MGVKVKTQQDYQRKSARGYLGKEALCAQLLKVAAPATGEAASINEAIQACLRTVCGTTNWPIAHARILAKHDLMGEHLPSDIWHVASGERFASLQAFDSSRLCSGTPWYSRILKVAKPIVFSDLASEPDFSAKQAAHELGLKSALGMPVLLGNKFKAVCEFFSYESMQSDLLLEQVIATLAAALARGIERIWLEQCLREMRSRLLNLQDDERKRLASELHDTTGQNISLIIIDIDTLEREAQDLSPAARARVAECGELARKSLQEIRTFSYLLYPPMLDELGILAALRVFVEGFSERSGITVDLDLPEQPIRMSRDLETTIFRVVQEGLSNVLNHSQSWRAKVHVSFDRNKVLVTVEDEGKGLSSNDTAAVPSKIGVGIASMQERVKQCGGQLKLRPWNKGTQLEVSLPLPEMAKGACA